MTAQEDEHVFWWLLAASQHAGDFLKHLAFAGLHADVDNYAMLRPVLLQMMEKYPKYKRERLTNDHS